MSTAPPRAPLYTRTHDLCLWLELHRTARPSEPLLGELCGFARELLAQVAAALCFRRSRIDHIHAADFVLLRLRVLLRLCRDVHVITAAAARHVHGMVEPIGKMLGGWLRQLDNDSKGMDQSPAACSVAAPTTTTPTTAAPPTATTTTLTTTGTTTASGSSASASPPNPTRRRRAARNHGRAGPSPARDPIAPVTATAAAAAVAVAASGDPAPALPPQ